MSTSFEGSASRREFPIKRDGGQNVTGTRFCPKSHPRVCIFTKNYTAGYAFLYTIVYIQKLLKLLVC